MGRDYPGDFGPGPSSSDDLNKLSRGYINGFERATNLSNIDGIDIVGSFDITVPAGRRQRFYAGALLRSETPGGVQLRVQVGGTQIDRKNFESLGGSADAPIVIIKDKELDAGTYTVALYAGRSGDDADNLVTVAANGETGSFGVAYCYCDDAGPATGDD